MTTDAAAEPREADAPPSFVRPVPKRVWALLLLGFLLVAGSPGILLIGVGQLGPSLLTADGPLGGERGLPLLLAWAGVLAFLPLPSVLFALVAIRRRYGRCELRGDVATFSLPWSLGKGLAYPRSELTILRATRHGLLLGKEGRPRWHDLLFPLLVPAPDEDARAAALAVFEGRPGEERPSEVPETFGGELSRGATIAIIVTVVSLVFAPAVILGLRLGELGFHAGLGVATVQILVILAGGVVTARRYGITRISLTSDALLLGPRRLAWKDLIVLAPAPPWLVWDAGAHGGRGLTHAGEHLETILDRARARLAALDLPDVLADAPPAWARSPRRHAPLAIVTALAAALGLAATGLAFTDPELYRTVAATDDEGNGARLVHRRTDGHPRALLLIAGDGSPQGLLQLAGSAIVAPGLVTQKLGSGLFLTVDLEKGTARSGSEEVPIPTDATVIILDVTDDTWRSSTEPLPARLTERFRSLEGSGHRGAAEPSIGDLLDGLGGTEPGGLIDRFASGALAPRVHDVVAGGGARLVWGVDRGEVLFCTVAPAATRLRIHVGATRHETAGDPDAAVIEILLQKGAPPPVTRVLEDDSTRRGETLPSFEALLEATARIRGGLSVEDALADETPDLFGE